MTRHHLILFLSIAACENPNAANATPASEPAAVALPNPTRSDKQMDMRYFYWEPGVHVVGSDRSAKAKNVLGSLTVRRMLGIGKADGFVHDHSSKSGKEIFVQVVHWKGKTKIAWVRAIQRTPEQSLLHRHSPNGLGDDGKTQEPDGLPEVRKIRTPPQRYSPVPVRSGVRRYSATNLAKASA